MQDERRLPGVDGLRALAATGIILFHAAGLLVPAPAELSFIGTHFVYAVPLFFVVSGFSLGYSTSAHVGRPQWIEIYLLKRFYRIAPLFYVVLAFTCAFFYFRNAAQDFRDILLNLTFMFNFFPGKHGSIVFAGWTIGVEMVFYALFPLILVCTKRIEAVIIATALAVAISLTARSTLEALPGLPPSYAIRSFVSNLHYFMLGLLAFRLFAILRG